MTKKFNCNLLLVVLGLSFILITLSGVTECIYMDQETSGKNSFTAWTPEIWAQSKQVDFNSGVLVHADTASIPGSVRIQCAPDSFVYALAGGGREAFWMYNPFTGNWTAVNNSLRSVGAGGGLAYAGAGDLYAFRGNESKDFWKYNLSTGVWHNLTSSPYNASFEGGSLAYDGAARIYAFTTDSLSGVRFFNYKISNGTWKPLASLNSSYNVGLGTLLACDGVNSVYALPAASETHFLKYEISTNKWNYSLNVTPFPTSYGAALAYDGDRNSIYALRGNSSSSFWRYDIGNDTWHNLSNTPGLVEAGASLAYDGGRHVYALQGNSAKGFWSYDLDSKSWHVLADTPGPVGPGGSLAFVPDPAGEGGHFSGLLSSKVLDSKNNGTVFNGLFREENLNDDTDISFEVRANDTLFLKNASTPAWVQLSGSVPIIPVSGRYMQWRANLTTTNLSKSPLLHGVRLYYTI